MHFRFSSVAVPLSVLAFVACTMPAEDCPDGEFEDGALSGKADGGEFTDCELDAVRAMLNDPATDAEVLRAVGVHTRAARNLITYRDEQDDNSNFDDIDEVDDVSYVGPVAFRQLVAAVADECEPGTTGEQTAEVIFSPQEYSQSHLARVADEIDAAELSLDIAMYSFSDSGIQAAIGRALDRGVRVRMIFESANGDHNDPAGSMSSRLEDLGVDVRYVNKIMHHKFVMIDGPQTSAEQAPDAMLITGSGNWSNSAGTRYDENTTIIQGNAEVVLRFQREFNHLWANSRDLLWNDNLEYFETLAISDEMILDTPAIDAVFTSANFRTYEHATYGPTFGVIRGENEVSDRLVEMIWQAQESIWVASGHLRSRPISEALMERAAADPDLDIRVYLDNQEYISQSSHDYQVRDLEGCLEEAGTSDAQRQDCLDSGFLFSYSLHEAGIPVRFKYYCYRWHYSYAVQMHNKYMIFDGNVVASGSYNLSDNAEHNTMENVVIYDGDAFPELVSSFVSNFAGLWETAREDDLYGGLMEEITEGTDSFSIVFESMSLTWDEVTALKGAIRDNCPAINTYEYRSAPESHRWCER